MWLLVPALALLLLLRTAAHRLTPKALRRLACAVTGLPPAALFAYLAARGPAAGIPEGDPLWQIFPLLVLPIYGPLLRLPGQAVSVSLVILSFAVGLLPFLAIFGFVLLSG